MERSEERSEREKFPLETVSRRPLQALDACMKECPKRFHERVVLNEVLRDIETAMQEKKARHKQLGVSMICFCVLSVLKPSRETAAVERQSHRSHSRHAARVGGVPARPGRVFQVRALGRGPSPLRSPLVPGRCFPETFPCNGDEISSV